MRADEMQYERHNNNIVQSASSEVTTSFSS